MLKAFKKKNEIAQSDEYLSSTDKVSKKSQQSLCRTFFNKRRRAESILSDGSHP